MDEHQPGIPQQRSVDPIQPFVPCPSSFKSNLMQAFMSRWLPAAKQHDKEKDEKDKKDDDPPSWTETGFGYGYTLFIVDTSNDRRFHTLVANSEINAEEHWVIRQANGTVIASENEWITLGDGGIDSFLAAKHVLSWLQQQDDEPQWTVRSFLDTPMPINITNRCHVTHLNE